MHNRIIFAIILILFLSGCSQNNINKDQIQDLPIAEDLENGDLEVQTMDQETSTSSTEDIVLWIANKSWKATISLPGFEDVNDYSSDFTRFLLMQRKDDEMIISIFGENIENVRDTNSCREHYIEPMRDYIDNEDYLKEADVIIGANPINLSQREEFALADYDLIILLDKEEIIQKRMHAYRYYDDYCFDFHISKLYFNEGDEKYFYEIIDSIEFSDVGTISELKGARVALPPININDLLLGKVDP